MRRRQQTLKSLSLFAMALIGAMALVGIARRAATQGNDCLALFQDVPTGDENGGSISCNDCDPICDQDGVTTPNQTCTVKFRACVNLASGSCVAGTIKKLKVVKAKGVTGTLSKPSGTSSACGAFTAVVKLKGKGKKAGKTKLKVIVATSDKRKDKGTLLITCNPQPAASCPTTTSTSTSTSSTTSTSIACASCCGSANRLTFTTGAPQVGSGDCASSDGTVTGTLVDDTGTNLCNLRAGGLYFGGAGVGVPLPSVIPDMSFSVTKIQSCNATTGDFTIANTTDTDTGSNRTCSSANINNPEYPGKPGCLFGPPLPIPNNNSAATSTCVINRVSTSASGSGNCSGVTSINIPLLSDLYLTGPTDGLIPCPICTANPGPGTTCQAGPNSGQPCTPGSGTLGAAYPTSHDCPPTTNAFIGSLPIPFALSTGSQTKTSQDFSAQTFVFCGFCGQQFSPSFQNPPHPCTADSQCTTAPNTRCRQRTAGAFGQGPARTLTETGVQPACLTDGMPHASTLVSVFCIPPSYNSTVDAAADLPGPGAVALTGQAQALQ
jgi:hypothetical protein